jgi:hypothetical protein
MATGLVRATRTSMALPSVMSMTWTSIDSPPRMV